MKLAKSSKDEIRARLKAIEVDIQALFLACGVSIHFFNCRKSCPLWFEVVVELLEENKKLRKKAKEFL